MRKGKQKRLVAAGWWVGDADEFLGRAQKGGRLQKIAIRHRFGIRRAEYLERLTLGGLKAEAAYSGVPEKDILAIAKGERELAWGQWYPWGLVRTTVGLPRPLYWLAAALYRPLFWWRALLIRVALWRYPD